MPLQLVSPYVAKLRVAMWRHAVARALRLKMSRANVITRGLPRWQHVYGAITTLIQSTDPVTRHAMCAVEDVHEFQKIARPVFRELSEVSFSAEERRLIWEGINSWRLSFEGHLQGEIARRYAKGRKRTSYDVEDETPPDPKEAEILVENIEDGSLKRRAVKGGARIVH